MVWKSCTSMTLLLPFNKKKNTKKKEGRRTGDISDKDGDEDGTPNYMLCLDRHSCLLKRAHELGVEREQGDGVD
jgi:hypothetical protein